MRTREKDYAKIIANVNESRLLLLQPMNVRALLQLDTKAAYDLFNSNKSFPSMKISGKNYIMRESFVKWVNDNYGKYIRG